MNEDTEKIAGIIYKHGENDFSIWIPDLTESENEVFNSSLEKFVDSGCSTRGSKQEVIAEIEESII